MKKKTEIAESKNYFSAEWVKKSTEFYGLPLHKQNPKTEEDLMMKLK